MNASVLKITLLKSNDNDLPTNLHKQVLIDNIKRTFVQQHPRLAPLFALDDRYSVNYQMTTIK